MLRSKYERWGAIAGIVSAVLLVVAIFLFSDFTNATDQEVLDFYADDGEQTRVIGGFYVWAIAALAFTWFVSTLYRVLRRTENDPSTFSTMALVTGTAFAALLLVAGAAMATVAGAIQFGDLDPAELDTGFARILPQLGWGVFLLGGGFMAAGHLFAVSAVSYQTGLFPRWLTWLGLVGSIVLLFAALFFPMIALPIWVIAVSIVLLTGKGMAERPAAM